MVDMICACGTNYKARQVDLDRGWGKSCSKKCATKKKVKEKLAGVHVKAPASEKYVYRKDGRNAGYDPKTGLQLTPEELKDINLKRFMKRKGLIS